MPDHGPIGRVHRDAGDDFRDALHRLLANDPVVRELRDLRDAGKLRVNLTTVAKEAERSRTLIGSPKCAYPQVREEILKAADRDAKDRIERGPDRLNAKATIRRFREEVGRLRREKSALATRLDTAINVARDLERKLTKVEAAAKAQKRAAEGRPPAPASPVPLAVKRDATVLRFPNGQA